MRFGIALLAVLLGTIVYFLLLPRLPAVLRHQPMRIDPGLALDFFFCLGLRLGLTYGIRRAQVSKD